MAFDWFDALSRLGYSYAMRVDEGVCINRIDVEALHRAIGDGVVYMYGLVRGRPLEPASSAAAPSSQSARAAGPRWLRATPLRDALIPTPFAPPRPLSPSAARRRRPSRTGRRWKRWCRGC